MTETAPENDSKGWKKFLRKHWNMLVLFVVGAVLASVGAVYVFLWFIGDAQSTGLVPTTLGLWSMGNMVTFLLYLIFWEVLLIGVPVILASVAGWLCWRKLPIEEKKEYHFFGTHSRSTSGGGAISILFWIAFGIKVFIDGNWNVAVATWTLDYLVYSCIWTLIWILIIFGIPACVIGLIWWISHERKKKP
jgi:hypothetical protein